MTADYATYDLCAFGLKEMIHAGRALRTLEDRPSCMEEAATTVVNFFHDRFRSKDGHRNCVLSRCFKTHPYGALPLALQEKSQPVFGAPARPETQCLTLLATRGDRPDWNNRLRSAGHQAIPLPTAAMVAQAPMILQLMLQMGLRPEDIVGSCTPDQEKIFDVFHVPQARGSAIVPDQANFVEPHGVTSVLGFGGILPEGELFAFILFTRVAINAETAALFRTLALSVKLHLLPFSGKRVFADAFADAPAQLRVH